MNEIYSQIDVESMLQIYIYFRTFTVGNNANVIIGNTNILIITYNKKPDEIIINIIYYY